MGAKDNYFPYGARGGLSLRRGMCAHGHRAPPSLLVDVKPNHSSALSTRTRPIIRRPSGSVLDVPRCAGPAGEGNSSAGSRVATAPQSRRRSHAQSRRRAGRAPAQRPAPTGRA
eukprot:4414461-Prymnesium_polylepis.1